MPAAGVVSPGVVHRERVRGRVKNAHLSSLPDAHSPDRTQHRAIPEIIILGKRGVHEGGGICGIRHEFFLFRPRQSFADPSKSYRPSLVLLLSVF